MGEREEDARPEMDYWPWACIRDSYESIVTPLIPPTVITRFTQCWAPSEPEDSKSSLQWNVYDYPPCRRFDVWARPSFLAIFPSPHGHLRPLILLVLDHPII
jgi:hypothetical protein